MFRVKQILRGEKDAFIEASQLSEGMTLLDCTLGLASDSIVASLVTGENGSVTGIESSTAISFVVRSGLKVWESKLPEMNAAMRRIEVVQSNHYEFLKNNLIIAMMLFILTLCSNQPSLLQVYKV